MNEIESKVAKARRRLILGRFGRLCCLTVFAGLLIATVAIAMPALMAISIDQQNWAIGWVIAGVAGGLSVAAIVSLWSAPTLQQTAQEVDRRFGLSERLSSSLGLPEKDRDTEFGAALASDARSRASQLSIADRFALRPSKLGWLPVAMLPMLVIVFLLADPVQNEGTETPLDAATATEVRQIKTVAKQLKKSLEQQRKKADEEGLEEAKELFEKMEADLDKITDKKQMTRKDALIALNDLKQQLEERRERLGSPDQIRKAMAQMKGLDAGPADKVAQAMQKGDFKEAEQVVKDLAEKIKNGKLSDQEKEQLKKQIEQMQKKMADAVKEHQQKKEDLQRQIDQARQEGRTADAEKMQQKMNEMEQQDGQMQKMQQMADAMNQAAQAMQQGDSSAAADALQDMAGELGEMADEMSELEDLDAAMDDLLQSKNQMGCKQCQGMGCSSCQGGGMGDGFGDGMGKGTGRGDRPEEETDTNFYDSQVRGKVKRGKAIIAGFADGPNRKGVTREDIRNVIASELDEAANPLENQNLPRPEQEHTQQYFDRLREGG